MYSFALVLSLQIIEESQEENMELRELFMWNKQYLPTEVKRDVREGCSLSVCSFKVKIWPNPSLHPQKKKRKRKKKLKHHTAGVFFLHHLAFLRHIKVLTFQADRLAEEQPDVTQST